MYLIVGMVSPPFLYQFDNFWDLPCNYDLWFWFTFNFSSNSGPDNLDNLRRLAEQFQKQVPGASSAEAGASTGAAQDDDDDVPELVPGETFEEAAEEKKESS